jgi:osmotically-inducible protein OsmY
MMQKTDAQLASDVTDELVWDPAIDNAAITVSARNHAITLGGATSSYNSKWEAESAAFRVLGVQSVTNKITVDPRLAGARPDADIAQDIRTALALDLAVPMNTISVSVTDGFATLSGNVDWNYQRAAADVDARRVRGVLGVVDEMLVRQPPATASEISDSIMRAFSRDAELYDDNVKVTTSGDGTVTLSGNVATWYERDLAEDTAWRARGVTEVIDDIAVGYPDL